MTEEAKLLSAYEQRHSDFLQSMASNIEAYTTELIRDNGIQRVDRVSARAKDPKKYVSKAFKKNDDGSLKYDDPHNQIQDQIGLRIIVFYLSDIAVIEREIVDKYFHKIEKRYLSPDDQWKFGYFGQHHILLTPKALHPPGIDTDGIPWCFELQIKTLFQHAWSEANHDIYYKPTFDSDIPDDEKRKLAYAAAQAWGADQIFNDLQQKLTPKD